MNANLLFIRGSVSANEVGINIQSVELSEAQAMMSVESVENGENMSRESLEIPSFSMFSF